LNIYLIKIGGYASKFGRFPEGNCSLLKCHSESRKLTGKSKPLPVSFVKSR
jgi:hypothetical protein